MQFFHGLSLTDTGCTRMHALSAPSPHEVPRLQIRSMMKTYVNSEAKSRAITDITRELAASLAQHLDQKIRPATEATSAAGSVAVSVSSIYVISAVIGGSRVVTALEPRLVCSPSREVYRPVLRGYFEPRSCHRPARGQDRGACSRYARGSFQCMPRPRG